jgi:error-prone DNA polymerase
LRARGFHASSALSRCAKGQTVHVAGLLVVHQAPPTAKGVHFLTLEDEFGFINVIVKLDLYRQARQIIRDQPLLHVIGHIQHEGDVTNVIAMAVQPLARKLPRSDER